MSVKSAYASGLQRRLLRRAEQEIGEVGARRPGNRCTPRCIESGERERSPRIGVRLTGGNVEPIISAEAHLMLVDRMRPKIARRQPVVGTRARRRTADACKAGE